MRARWIILLVVGIAECAGAAFFLTAGARDPSRRWLVIVGFVILLVFFSGLQFASLGVWIPRTERERFFNLAASGATIFTFAILDALLRASVDFVRTFIATLVAFAVGTLIYWLPHRREPRNRRSSVELMDQPRE